MCHMTFSWSSSSLACHWAEMDPIPHVRADRTWVAVLLLLLWNSLCDNTAVLQLSHREHIGTENQQGMQETLTLTTGAPHLSKFLWLLYTSLWFAAHGAPCSVHCGWAKYLKDHATVLACLSPSLNDSCFCFWWLLATSMRYIIHHSEH